MSSELLKGTLIVVLIACVGVMIYSVINAISVSKRNKAKDEATREIFLAKIQKERENAEERPITASKFTKEPVNFVPAKPKELDYDKVDDDIEESVVSDKHLKDFFKP